MAKYTLLRNEDSLENNEGAEPLVESVRKSQNSFPSCLFTWRQKREQNTRAITAFLTIALAISLIWNAFLITRKDSFLSCQVMTETYRSPYGKYLQLIYLSLQRLTEP